LALYQAGFLVRDWLVPVNPVAATCVPVFKNATKSLHLLRLLGIARTRLDWRVKVAQVCEGKQLPGACDLRPRNDSIIDIQRKNYGTGQLVGHGGQVSARFTPSALTEPLNAGIRLFFFDLRGPTAEDR
jgi:hypothetical protein